MRYRSLFPRDLFAELDRLQREVHSPFDTSPGIRGLGRGGYPALNVGTTPTSVEVWAFAPGMAPDTIEVHLERGVLTLSGERAAPPKAPSEEKTTQHLAERFSGRFRRVVSLPDDIDPDAVEARYRDGVLHVSVSRRAALQPRRIDVQ
jgi:HSP20 family protein